MTTLVRTWTTTPNGALDTATYTTLDAQAKAETLAEKVLMLAAGWTVIASSNGTTADATDRWATVADLTWAAGGVAHSWIVLRSPAAMCGSGRYIYRLIDLSTGATNQHLRNITWSSSTFTGGSTTAAPAATAGTYRTFTNRQYLRSAVANAKYHTKYSDEGDVIVAVSFDGSGRFSTVNTALKLGNVRSGILYPVFTFEGWQDSGAGPFYSSNAAGSTNVTMWNNDGTLAATFGIASITLGAELMASFGASGDFTGAYPDLPGIVATGLGIYGTLVDVALAPSGTTGGAIVQGTEEPAVGASTHEIMGGFWAPKVGGSASSL